MKYQDTNSADRVPSRDTPPAWLAAPKPVDPPPDPEADALARLAEVLTAAIRILERCPPGTTLHGDGRVTLPARPLMARPQK